MTDDDFLSTFPEKYSAKTVLLKIRDALRHAEPEQINYFSVLHENFILMNHSEWLEFASLYPVIAPLITEPTGKYYIARDNNAQIISRVVKGLYAFGYKNLTQRKIYEHLAGLVFIATTRSAESVCNPTSSDCTQLCNFRKEMSTGRIVTACEHSNTVFSFPDGEQLHAVKFDYALAWDDLVKAGAVSATANTAKARRSL